MTEEKDKMQNLENNDSISNAEQKEIKEDLSNTTSNNKTTKKRKSNNSGKRAKSSSNKNSDDTDEELDEVEDDADDEQDDDNEDNIDNSAKKVVKTAKKFSKDMQNFIGLYYGNYTEPAKLWALRILIIIVAVGITSTIPLIMKAGGYIWIVAFILVWDIGIIIVMFTTLKNKPMNIFYCVIDGKPVTVYWDLKNKKYFIVNFGKGKKFKYVIKYKEWFKSDDDLVPQTLYFDQIKSNSKFRRVDNKLIIDSYKVKSKKQYKNASLVLENGKPILIECLVTRMLSPHHHKLGSVPGEIKKRLIFTEINTDKYMEIPSSFIDFCKKHKVAPPEENEFWRYTDRYN